MAKITQYQQGAFASAVTSGPQFDNTGINMLGHAADTAIDSTVNLIKEKVYPNGTPGEQRKAARQAAIAAQKSAALQLAGAERAAYVADKVGAADQELTSVMTQTKQQHFNNTDNAAGTMQQAALEVRRKFVDAEQDPLRKAELDKALSQRTASYTDNILKWAETRQVPIMESRVAGTADSFKTKLSNADLSAAEVGQSVQQYYKDNGGLYGFVNASPENASAKMKNATEEGVKQWLAITALKQPEKLEARVQSVSGGKLIDPTKLTAFVNEQKAIARDVMKTNAIVETNRKQGVQLTAGLEIAQASPTGNPKDAPADVYNKVLQKYGSDLTPEQQIRFTTQRQEAIAENTKKVNKQQEFNTNIDYAHQFGKNAANENAHAANIESLIGQVMDKKNPNRLQLLPKLQNAIDQYQDNYTNLQAGINAISDPAVRKIANLHMVAAKERFGDIVGKLNNTPVGQQTKAAKNSLYAQVHPTLSDPDPKKNAIYNYFYQNAFYDFLQQKNLSPDVLQKASKNAQFTQALKTRLHHESYVLMRDAGLLK